VTPPSATEIRGELYGHRLASDTGDVVADIVHVTVENRPAGPAENAFVMVERVGQPRARYISWINYYDLDYVNERLPGCWRHVEPAEAYAQRAQWQPYGWPGALPAPTVGSLPATPHPRANPTRYPY
jgi:hypothetical protein